MDHLRRALGFFGGRRSEGEDGEAKSVQIDYECECTDRVDWEADLQERLAVCEKNPGHKGFIPIEDIAMEHLPEKYGDDELLEFVKVTGELTVRLVVSHTSDRRPDKFPENKEEMRRVPGYPSLVGKDYPYAWCKGKTDRRVGVGRVVHVERGNIHVKTAAHIICAEDEANKCEADFFYNRSEDKTAGKTKFLSGANLFKRSVERDGCEIIFTTDDAQLLERLKAAVRRWADLQNLLTVRHRSVPEMSLPFFIVSHPHGLNKVVTWGWVVEEDRGMWLGDEQVIYNIPTCPGSSGAAVVCIGKLGQWDDGYHHSGHFREGLGRSGSWFFSVSNTP